MTKNRDTYGQTPIGQHKRPREKFEHENDVNVEMDHVPAYQTPKRQRRIPLAMPLGLSYQDFASLELDPLTVAVDMAQTSRDAEDEDVWTADDDRILIETVLEKLKPSKFQWNECARSLGKDSDSLNSRWRILVRDGNVGLRS